MPRCRRFTVLVSAKWFKRRCDTLDTVLKLLHLSARFSVPGTGRCTTWAHGDAHAINHQVTQNQKRKCRNLDVQIAFHLTQIVSIKEEKKIISYWYDKKNASYRVQWKQYRNAIWCKVSLGQQLNYLTVSCFLISSLIIFSQIFLSFQIFISKTGLFITQPQKQLKEISMAR